MYVPILHIILKEVHTFKNLLQSVRVLFRFPHFLLKSMDVLEQWAYIGIVIKSTTNR